MLIAGGIGCTPLMSILRHAVLREPSKPITCLFSFRTEKDLAFRSELALLKRQHPHVRIGVTLTREQRPGFLSGRIDESLLRRAAADPANTLFFISGPAPMIDEMKKLLAGLGVSESQIRREIFDNAAIAPRERDATDRPDSDARQEEPVPAAEVLLFPRKEQVRQVLRFARGEMMLHWAIAIPFLICFATGVTMKIFYNLHSGSLFREVLSFLHRVSGCCLAVFPPLAVARNWRDYKVHIYNVKVGFSWTIDDLKWLFLVGPATVSKKIVLPEQRKFNAAERLNFMMVLVTYPLFVATGAFLWATGVDHFLPWLLHISMSLVAPLLMMGHIYMAVVNPSTRVGLSGMVTGRVDRDWAKHHYQSWYREHFEEDGTPRMRGTTSP
ncbi:MAG: cytochrome b/b6 domain-containing protein [Thermoanaerobaculia bacterium]